MPSQGIGKMLREMSYNPMPTASHRGEPVVRQPEIATGNSGSAGGRQGVAGTG